MLFDEEILNAYPLDRPRIVSIFMLSAKNKIFSFIILIIGVGTALIIQTHRVTRLREANLFLEKGLEVAKQENRRLTSLTNFPPGSGRDNGRKTDEVKRLLLEEIPSAIHAVLKKPLGQHAASFKVIVATVDPADIAKAVAILDTFPNYEAKTKLRSLFLSRWAEIDPKAAIAVAEATSGGENRKEGMLAVAKGWAESDLNSAVSWVRNLPVSQIRNTMLQSIVTTLAESDPQKAAAMSLELPGRFQIFAAQQVAEKWAQADPDSALAWVRSLPAGGAQTRALTAASKAFAEANPQSAADLVDLLPRSNRAQFLDNIAHSWAENDLSTAIAWAQRLEGKDQEIALRGVCERWSQTDPKAAATFMERSQPALLYSLGVNWGANDPNAALEWADQLNDKKTRTEMYNAVTSGWAQFSPGRCREFRGETSCG
jgi:hypothetical protein